MKLKILQRFITLATLTFILFVSYNLVFAANQKNTNNPASPYFQASPSTAPAHPHLDKLE